MAHRKLALIAFGPLAVPGAVAAGAAAPPRSAHVTLKDIALHPARVVIRRGGTVTWTFADGSVTHNVTSRGLTRSTGTCLTPERAGATCFKGSGDRQTGTYAVRFTRAGTYRYECTIHPGAMDGTVVVR